MSCAVEKDFAPRANPAMIRPLLQKTAAGFRSLCQRRGKSRMEPPRSAALFICASSFMVARWEGASPAGFREVARSANPSSHRPRFAAGAAVVANRNLWRPFMAHPQAFPDKAHSKLSQLQGLLNSLCYLSGEAAVAHPKSGPPMNNVDLHYALWGMSDMLEDVMDLIDSDGEGEQA